MVAYLTPQSRVAIRIRCAIALAATGRRRRRGSNIRRFGRHVLDDHQRARGWDVAVVDGINARAAAAGHRAIVGALEAIEAKGAVRVRIAIALALSQTRKRRLANIHQNRPTTRAVAAAAALLRDTDGAVGGIKAVIDAVLLDAHGAAGNVCRRRCRRGAALQTAGAIRVDQAAALTTPQAHRDVRDGRRDELVGGNAGAVIHEPQIVRAVAVARRDGAVAAEQGALDAQQARGAIGVTRAPPLTGRQ